MSFTLIGVAHLLPLPAGPRESPGFAPARLRALHDAAVLAEAGFDGLILENFGDAPFPAGPVESHVVAFVAMLASQIRERHPGLRIGINLLRNDARAAMGVAAAVGADFIRVNVHTGAMVTDQGLLQGDAHGTLRYRRELGADPDGPYDPSSRPQVELTRPGSGRVQIAADVLVKHAVPLGNVDVAAVASDTAARGGADILIVTGDGTGRPADPDRVARVRKAAPGVPVWLGSGVTADTLPDWARLADGAIVGTALHENGDVRMPLSRASAVRMRAAG